MIDQRMRSNLLDEARSVLGSAEDAIESLQARIGNRQAAPLPDTEQSIARTTANIPPAAMRSSPEQRSQQEVIMKRLSALNIRALESARDELATVMTFYVTSAVAYNHHLETLQTDATTLDPGIDVDVNYYAADGTPGIRIGDVIRVRTNPGQTLAELTSTILSRHHPADQHSDAKPSDNGVEPRRVTTPSQVPPARLLETSDRGVVQPPARLRAPQSLIEGRESSRSSGPGPTFDQTAVVRMMDDHARDITQLRAQLNRQAEILSQLAQLIDAAPASDA